MSLSKLPVIGFDSALTPGYPFIAIRNAAGWWTGAGYSEDKADAKAIPVTDDDGIGDYSPDPEDLVDLPAGPHAYYGFVSPTADPLDIVAAGAAIDGDDEWYWDGDSGETLSQIVEEAIESAAEDGTIVIPPADGVVGKYITQGDLEAHYDADVIRQWSRKGPTEESTDVVAIQKAIASAEALVDAKLKKRYPLPLTDPDGETPITDGDAAVLLLIARPLAGAALYFQRPAAAGDDQANSLRADVKAAMAELDLYTTGAQYLDAPQIDRTPRAPGVVT